MACFHFLPARHHAGASADGDAVPGGFEVGVGDCAGELGVGGEGYEVVAIELVIVICHCVDEATDDGFGDICWQALVYGWLVRISERRRTFVLGLSGWRVASDKVLIITIAQVSQTARSRSDSATHFGRIGSKSMEPEISSKIMVSSVATSGRSLDLKGAGMTCFE